MPSTSSAVHLGLPVQIPPERLFTLERHFLPLGKIGGFPAWLNPASIPESEELACQNCGLPMAFLLQIYCTSATDPEQAFHRAIYLFACRNGKCAKTNNASNFAVFRCQLPRQNPFYSPAEALNPSLVGNVADPLFNVHSYAKLCIVCGCRAAKRCAKCARRIYCSREHQIIDWKTAHREECGTEQRDYSTLDCIEKSALRHKHGFTFREFGMEVVGEEAADVESNCSEEESSDDDEMEPDADTFREEKQKMQKYNGVAEENGVTGKDFEALEESRGDAAFRRFSQTIAREPEQVLRYQRGGRPLLATDFSPEPGKVPDCPLCERPRQFEFQLMPHLLALIDVDTVGQSLDWATLMVYTCQNSCPIPDDGYTREWLFKQDFVGLPKEEDGGEK